ncbi:mutator protein MutT [Pseudonocardia sediminis]|uniref:Mutator protein MutT n=1 Tax=Pseudonocardia sediminis TaxID=1397368 RepID=A0A4Q7V094_PSEST|nr:NUDIX domain-containing protein [Pseudonocardia sediminis]RZT85899.1 mutator protein MutT [Pseudonocardia sediminis]
MAYAVAAVGVVVGDDGRVLVVQRRDNGRWEPPGGHLETGETPAQAACREVEEETGVRVEAGPLTGVYTNVVRDIVVIAFRCRAVGGAPHPTEESQRVEWWTRDRVVEAMPPAFAVRVTDALDAAPAPSRAHDGHDLLPG